MPFSRQASCYRDTSDIGLTYGDLYRRSTFVYTVQRKLRFFYFLDTVISYFLEYFYTQFQELQIFYLNYKLLLHLLVKSQSPNSWL